MAPGLGKGRKQGGDGISTGLSLEMERVKMEMERVKRVEFAKECQESENDKQPQDPCVLYKLPFLSFSNIPHTLKHTYIAETTIERGC